MKTVIDLDRIENIEKNTNTNTSDITTLKSQVDNTHLYVLTIYYSDTSFITYVNDIGIFELNTEYLLCESDKTYSLTDEQTTSLMSILNKIKVGNYGGIPLTYVGDLSEVFINKSTYTTIDIYGAENLDSVLEISLYSKEVMNNEGEDWFFKFTKLI